MSPHINMLVNLAMLHAGAAATTWPQSHNLMWMGCGEDHASMDLSTLAQNQELSHQEAARFRSDTVKELQDLRQGMLASGAEAAQGLQGVRQEVAENRSAFNAVAGHMTQTLANVSTAQQHAMTDMQGHREWSAQQIVKLHTNQQAYASVFDGKVRELQHNVSDMQTNVQQLEQRVHQQEALIGQQQGGHQDSDTAMQQRIQDLEDQVHASQTQVQQLAQIWRSQQQSPAVWGMSAPQTAVPATLKVNNAKFKQKERRKEKSRKRAAAHNYNNAALAARAVSHTHQFKSNDVRFHRHDQASWLQFCSAKHCKQLGSCGRARAMC